MTHSQQVDPSIVEQAISWYVRAAAGEPDTAAKGAALKGNAPTLQEELRRWLAQNPEHQRAWDQLQHMGNHMLGLRELVPPTLARQTLEQAQSALTNRHRRRLVLRSLGLTAGTGLTGWLAHQHTPLPTRWAMWHSTESTAVGERRSLTLDDGTQLVLNTATAIDIHDRTVPAKSASASATTRQRTIVLHTGEIMVTTGQHPQRPQLLVHTPAGSLQPLGTRFAVLHTGEAGRNLPNNTAPATRLAVEAGEVRIHPTHASHTQPHWTLRSNQQAWFDHQQVGSIQPLQPLSTGWVNGMFIAERMRLDRLAAELARYRPGKLQCAPAAAALQITGAWPLQGAAGVDAILQSITRNLPVQVVHRTRWWTRIEAA